ncbi:hypothetical protein PWT90_07656 [Aphanocladium album]|nr:hypothetical protein PWT90_07656 [Aphanocladium album]
MPAEPKLRPESGTALPTNRAVTQRKKVWAERSRTGCFTCRKRHLKCDEEIPVCKRCLLAKLECRYGTLVPSGGAIQAKEKNYGKMRPHQHSRVESRGEYIAVEAEPPDWDLLQTIRYYFEFIRPLRPAVNGKVVDPTFTLGNATYYGIKIVSAHIALLSKSYGRGLKYGEGRALAPVWATYSRYLLKIIAVIHDYFQDTSPTAVVKAIDYMLLLLLADLDAESTVWKAHINGCYAYVQRIGGIQALLDLSSPPPVMFRQFVKYVDTPYIMATRQNSARCSLLTSSSLTFVYNTTTPPLEHCLGYYDYTDEQLGVILLNGDRIYHDRPFPIPHALVLIHLTRLRYELATSAWEAPPWESLVVFIRGQYRKLHSFDEDGWAVQTTGYSAAHHKALAEVYRVAIWLYAILTLPRPAVSQWAEVDMPLPSCGQAINAYDRVRTLYRSELLTCLRRVYHELTYPRGVYWPLIVAGVAAVDGAEEDRAFVDDCMHSIWLNPLGGSGMFSSLEKLRRFWASGKTNWDDCFYEPTPC